MPEPASRPRWALAAKGFRPFFLLAAVFASAIVPLWILAVAGVLRLGGYLDATSWHAHEMVFGYTVAVLAGFLLTAVGNWTQRETIVGRPLLALSALWGLGRVTMVFAGALPRELPALIDLAFLPALILVLARPLVAARNRRNFIMLGVLGALFAANVVVHLDALGVMASGAARHACLVAIDVVVLVILVISGRVFPTFTRNATGVTSIRSSLSLDVLTIGGMAMLTVLDVLVPERAGAAGVAGAVGVLAIVRAARWGTRHTARQPLVWILHAGYGWLALGLLLRALAGFESGRARIPGNARVDGRRYRFAHSRHDGPRFLGPHRARARRLEADRMGVRCDYVGRVCPRDRPTLRAGLVLCRAGRGRRPLDGGLRPLLGLIRPGASDAQGGWKAGLRLRAGQCKRSTRSPSSSTSSRPALGSVT